MVKNPFNRTKGTQKDSIRLLGALFRELSQILKQKILLHSNHSGDRSKEFQNSCQKFKETNSMSYHATKS